MNSNISLLFLDKFFAAVLGTKHCAPLSASHYSLNTAEPVRFKFRFRYYFNYYLGAGIGIKC